MSTKKTTTKSSNNATIRPSLTGAGADPIPAVGAPRTPPGFDASVPLGRGPTIKVGQTKAASLAAAELSASATYTQDFGTRVPEKSVIAKALVFAAGWSTEAGNAASWAKYAKLEQREAWSPALALMAALRPFFVLTTQQDSELAAKYPATAQYFEATRAPSKRAASTRKAKKRAAAPAAATATSPKGTAAAEQGTATAATAPAAVAPITPGTDSSARSSRPVATPR
jgi:hypothetical protein